VTGFKRNLTGAYHIPGAIEPATPPVIIAPARAVMSRTMPRREFLKATRSIKAGQTINPEETIRYWVSIGYDPVNTVVSSGQFARRGGILDLWLPAYSLPIRIELFGDEIESIRPFEPSTQRTIKSSDQPPQGKYLVSPGREYLLNERVLKDAEQGASEFSEFQIPLLHPTPASILDYLPQKALILIDDLQAVQETIEDVEELSVKLRQD
jgi:transcription-repair coupling factor (superfamily II helicase)